MRKIIALFLLISIAVGLCGCVPYHSGEVDVKQIDGSEPVYKISLADFAGEKQIEIDHPAPSEGSMNYTVAVSEGELSCRYKDLTFLKGYELFRVSAGNSDEGGAYVDSSVTRVILLLSADLPTDAEIIISFN